MLHNFSVPADGIRGYIAEQHPFDARSLDEAAPQAFVAPDALYEPPLPFVRKIPEVGMAFFRNRQGAV